MAGPDVEFMTKERTAVINSCSSEGKQSKKSTMTRQSHWAKKVLPIQQLKTGLLDLIQDIPALVDVPRMATCGHCA
jgi:hypothetical protein